MDPAFSENASIEGEIKLGPGSLARILRIIQTGVLAWVLYASLCLGGDAVWRVRPTIWDKSSLLPLLEMGRLLHALRHMPRALIR